MRILKIAAIAFAAVFGLVAIALVWVLVVVDPNDYKADIERLAQERTQRRLVLQGDLQLSVFPWLAVEMGPAQLNERADFAAGETLPFIAFQKARLSVRLWPLLRGQVEIGEVQLIGPSVRLITDLQGRHNWDDLAGSKTDAATPAPSDSGPVEATVAGIEIREGEVILDDRREKTLTKLRDFSLQAQGIGSGKPFDLKTAFALQQNDAASTRVELAANVNADWNNKRYALAKLDTRIAMQGAGFPKEGLPVTVRAESASLDMAQQTLQLTGLNLGVGVAQISGALAGAEIIDAPKFTGHIALASVSLPELARQMNVQLPATRDAQVLKRLSFDSDVVATSNSVALAKAELRLDDTTARGEFGVADFKAMALRFNLDIDKIDFDRYLPPQADAPAANAQQQTAAPTPIPVETLRTLNARGELRVGEAVFSGLKMSKLRFGVVARDGDIRVQPAQAALYGGGYQGDIALNVAGKQPKLAFVAKVADVEFAPLFKDMLDTQRISGKGAFNVDVTAVGADTDALLKALNGTLDFNVADGAYEGMDLWYEIRRARAVLKQQAIPERTGAARTPFTAIKGTGAVRDGVLNNPDLSVAMQYLTVDGKGTVDLANSTLDYRFNAKVLRIPPEGQAGSEMADLVNAEIPITATGPLASPKVRPDIEGYAKARAKQEIKKETDKLQEKLQDKLKDLLRR